MISFRPLSDQDAGLLMIWMQSPHVTQWWTQDGSTPEDELEEALSFIGLSDAGAFIIEHNRRSVGYIQYYNVHSAPNDDSGGFYFADQPAGSIGIDMFIGDVFMTGQGFGPDVLRQFAEELFAKGATRLLIDPNANNTHAIKAFEKAGFLTYQNHDSPRWGRVTLMCKTPKLSS